MIFLPPRPRNAFDARWILSSFVGLLACGASVRNTEAPPVAPTPESFSGAGTSSGTSVFSGVVDSAGPASQAGRWRVTVRVAEPTSTTTGRVVLFVDESAVVRGVDGGPRAMDYVTRGSRIRAWVGGAVVLSDPPLAKADSLQILSTPR
jgi:hypothetical protein